MKNAWDNTMIERIDIRLLESIGLEQRGNFMTQLEPSAMWGKTTFLPCSPRYHGISAEPGSNDHWKKSGEYFRNA